jgi:hypothetical protein
MLAAAAVAAVAWLIAGHQAAQAGHTFGSAHCKSSPPNCAYVYSSAGSNLIATQTSFAINDYRFSSMWPPTFESSLDQAEYNWAVAAGPQAPMEPPTLRLAYHMGNIYWDCESQPPPVSAGPPPCFVAKAFTCYNIPPSDNLVCDTFTNTARNITGSETFIRYAGLTTESSAVKVHVFAHELGHTLRLHHHEEDSPVCLMNDDLLPVTAPNTLLECDLGFADPFSSPELDPCDRDVDKWGIRCIYDWWREQGPAQDCHDPDRSGRVLASDIAIVVAAYAGTAGEPSYHPDTDYDHKGITLTSDITATVNQYGQWCGPPNPYPHS